MPLTIARIASFETASKFQEYLHRLSIDLPCDSTRLHRDRSPLADPIMSHDWKIGNRIAIHPMEGWDGTSDGKPTEPTLRRWRQFGKSGAKLIWGGEAVAVCHDGRANPNQLVIGAHTQAGLSQLRQVLVEEHRRATGSESGLCVGLQLTHSGRYSCPNVKGQPEPKILYHHPLLDRRLALPPDYPLLTDSEIRGIIADFLKAAVLAYEMGFDFVDIKHCHGYLGHEFLSAHTREGSYGGSFHNRTRFLREIVEGIRSLVPALKIGVRLSAFDSVPYRADPGQSSAGKPGTGIPESHEDLLPYRWGFGLNSQDPTQVDLSEAIRFLSLLETLNIRIVNLTAGSPYYNPHIQRPALFPPSDGYRPPEDPLIGVARQIHAVRVLKQRFPDLIVVGTGYSYLQEFLPCVAQALIREGWVDAIGLGRMVLTYPEMLWDVLEGRELQTKRICRTFSDCTTAPRNGLPSGCYPLDAYYKHSEYAKQLQTAKFGKRPEPLSTIASKEDLN
jgi:2,4-dienoyl-CoA reductase-like NADH-dependent reductase (Old Yellow Enzyme family)